MGKTSPTGGELANPVVSGTFVGTGQSASAQLWAKFNLSLWGTFVGTVELDRSFDGGTTFLPCAKDTSGNVASYTVPVSLVGNEPEQGVLYRLNCTAYTSGTINYRLSQSPNGPANAQGIY